MIDELLDDDVEMEHEQSDMLHRPQQESSVFAPVESPAQSVQPSTTPQQAPARAPASTVSSTPVTNQPTRNTSQTVGTGHQNVLPNFRERRSPPPHVSGPSDSREHSLEYQGAAAPPLMKQSEIEHHLSEEMQERIRQLEQEKEKIRESRLCKICLDKEVSVLFFPCKHLICCQACAPRLAKCPMCRKIIREKILVYQ